MRYRVTHKTAYRYSEPASLSQNELLLFPRQTPCQQAENSSLKIVPQPEYLHQRTDYFGNTVQVFMVQQPHDELTITAQSLIRTAPTIAIAPANTLPWEKAAGRLASGQTPLETEAVQYVFESPLAAVSPAVLDYTRPSFAPGVPVLAGAMDLMHRIFTDFTYDKTATTVDTPVNEILKNRKGVCQDFAHLQISCLRAVGLAARYVSGYLETSPPPGKPKLVGADASHAWLSLFVPEIGWVDMDPTNNLIPGEKHITIAWGRDYGDVTPVKGVVMGGGTHTLSVVVDVERTG